MKDDKWSFLKNEYTIQVIFYELFQAFLLFIQIKLLIYFCLSSIVFPFYFVKFQKLEKKLNFQQKFMEKRK